MSLEAVSPLPIEDERRRDAVVISLVGFAHGVSHFFQLLIPPLFPWLMVDFGLDYTQAGLLMTVFFAVSGAGQALSGFTIDRLGPARVLMGAVGCFFAAAVVLATAQSYAMLALAATLAGLGNCPVHPANFTVLNRRVASARLGHAFSAHGLAGYAGLALAPLFMTGLAAAFHWRVAAWGAAAIAVAVFFLLLARRASLRVEKTAPKSEGSGSAFAFLSVAAVWLCFAYFLLNTMAFGALQNYAPLLLRDFYGVGLATAASSLTAYMAAAAGGTLLGGFLASGHKHEERVIAVALMGAAGIALLIASAAVPAWTVLGWMAAMGFLTGIAGPSRDMLVRRAATSRFGHGAYGRVYGFVYSGLDIGLAASPLLFGPLMDGGRFSLVLIGVAVCQTGAVLMALLVGRHSAQVR